MVSAAASSRNLASAAVGTLTFDRGTNTGALNIPAATQCRATVNGTTYTFTTDGVSEHFTLPTDVYKVLGVDVQIASNPTQALTLREFMFGERNQFQGVGVNTASRHNASAGSLATGDHTRMMGSWYVSR